MNTQKPLLAGFVIGLFIALAPACGTTGNCNPSNCRTGCCDTKGQCQSGASSTACGQLGGMCSSCQLGTACNLGTCMVSGFGGGTQGGGTGGGTTGGGTTGGGTTGGGTTGGGTTGGGTTGGGTTGGGTTGGGTTGGGTTGGGSGCDGCIASGTTTCINLANSGTNSFCGRNGVTCATCGANQTCTNYQCVGGTGGGGGTTGGGGGTTGGGGGVTGGGGGTGVVIGMACTSDSQCTGLGSGAKCKLQTTPFGTNGPTLYPSGAGFCTVPCSGVGTCAGGAVCAGGVSSYPYLFNDVDQFCTRGCTATSQCASGLICAPASSLFTMGQPSGCILAGGSNLFTGGGFPTKAGNPCTTNTDCANPPDPALATCVTSFPGGYCLASSDLAPQDTWCDAAGKTEIYIPLADGGADFYCVGTCSPVGSVGNSRNGYTCFRKSSAAPTIGVQWPKCTGNTDCQGLDFADGGPTVCNLNSGFCCDTASGTTNCIIDFN